MYVLVYMYVFVFKYYVFVCMYLYLSMYVLVCINAYIYIWMYVLCMYSIYACMYICMSILQCHRYLPQGKGSTKLETFLYSDKIVFFIVIKSGKQLTVFSNISTSAILWMISTPCLFPGRTSSATECVPRQSLVHHECVIYA